MILDKSFEFTKLLYPIFTQWSMAWFVLCSLVFWYTDCRYIRVLNISTNDQDINIFINISNYILIMVERLVSLIPSQICRNRYHIYLLHTIQIYRLLLTAYHSDIQIDTYCIPFRHTDRYLLHYIQTYRQIFATYIQT